MQIQEKIDYLIEKAKRFKSFLKDNETLFDAVNNLTDKELKISQSAYSLEMALKQKSIRPVNLLRHLLVEEKKNGNPITPDMIENLKEKFNSKDEKFLSRFDADVRKRIENYIIGKRGPFNSWKNHFRILYTLLYNPFYETVTEYLADITVFISNSLQNEDLISHTVDFNGEQYFGSSSCWIAFFPSYKVSHTNAIQLFLRITNNGILYGTTIGHDLKRRIDQTKAKEYSQLSITNDFNEVIEFFQEKKEEVIRENQSQKQTWQFSPGKSGKYWDEMKNSGIIAIGWDELGDLQEYSTIEDISEALGVQSNSNQSWNVDLFRNASIGDIVIAKKGKKNTLGIGMITGNYEYRPEREYYKHVRNIDWKICQEHEFNTNLFRVDTFTPTTKYHQIKKAYIDKYPELEETFAKIEEHSTAYIDQKEETEEVEEVSDVNYYWLNANVKIWNFYDCEVEGRKTYTTYSSKGNKRRIYKYFLEVNPGDIMIGYLTSPVKQVVCFLEVTRSLFTDEFGNEAIEFKIVEFLENPVDLSILKNHPDLHKAEPIKNMVGGSLFKLTEDEFQAIQGLIADQNPDPAKEKILEYALEDALGDANIPRERFETMFDILLHKKQVVLQGAPGTGKTYMAKILARYLAKNEKNIDIIQFHPSYSYEDFVQGYKPTEQGGLRITNGIFLDICRKALTHRDEDFVLIIDEINRGDISKIFGELLYLLEYRDQKIKLSYSPESDFKIPKNLYIIGTMNLADRSLAMIDYALRRRFSFITLETDYDLIKSSNQDSLLDIETVIENIRQINRSISTNHALGKDFQLGHSYFLENLLDKQSIKRTWECNIKPLLLEYFFDNTAEVENLEDIFYKDADAKH